MKKIIVSSKLYTDKNGTKNILYDSDILSMLNKMQITKFPYLNSKLELVKNIHDAEGLILLGGGDLYKYKKNDENRLRDKLEKKLINLFLRKNKPILGICRGFQQIADSYGIKLIKKKDHVRKFHRLDLKKSRFLKYKNLHVNSYHNYCIFELPNSFNIVSKYKDGSIEIAEHKTKKILCLMFHPERKMKSQTRILNSIKNFFE